MASVEQVAEAKRLREAGLVWREIGERMGVSLSYAHMLASDPRDSQRRERRRRRSNRPTQCGRCSGPLTQAPKGVRLYCDGCAAANHRDQNRERWQVSKIAANERRRVKNLTPEKAQRKRESSRMHYITQGALTDHADIRILFCDPCSYCGGPTNLGVDHIIPIVIGGGGDWDNLTACCFTCNTSKRDRPLLRFLLRKVN